MASSQPRTSRRPGSASRTCARCRRRELRCSAATAEAPSHALITHRLGSSPLEVTEACLGTMTFGEQNTEAEGHAQLSLAAERGVNFIDTAELYPITPRAETQGRTSRFVGTWLQGQRRERFVVATKVAGRSAHMPWIAANRTEPPGEGGETRVDAANIRAGCEAELRRLQVDYVDLLQLHWPDRYYLGFGRNQYRLEEERDYTPFREQVAAIADLIKEGKVRHWGLSNETTFGAMSFAAAADALGAPRPASVQNCFNLVHRTSEGELAEACSPRHLNMAVLAWSPLCGGALTGKYLEGTPDNSRFALFPDRYPRYNTARVKRATEKYAKIAHEVGCSPSQLAIAYCRSRWFVTSTILGATSVEQLEETLDAFEMTLPEAALQAIDDVHLLHRNPALAH